MSKRLDALLAWMRKNGAVSARVGDVAITLPEGWMPVQVDQDPPAEETVRLDPLSIERSPLDDPDTYEDGQVPSLPKLTGRERDNDE